MPDSLFVWVCTTPNLNPLMNRFGQSQPKPRRVTNWQSEQHYALGHQVGTERGIAKAQRRGHKQRQRDTERVVADRVGKSTRRKGEKRDV